MVAISELLRSCLAQYVSLVDSGILNNLEVSLQKWTDELGRLRVWAGNIGGHKTGQSSLEYRLRDASHIKSQIVRLLDQVQELLTDLKDVIEESDIEAEDDELEKLEDLESWDLTEIQEIHQGLVDTINQLYQMSILIRKPAQHDQLVGTKKLDSEPFQFWAKQHTCNKYPNADALAIDRISSAMARQRAILKYRERHHAKLSHGIDPENDGKSTILSETVVTEIFKEIPGQSSDMASEAGVSETSYGGTLLEGTGADAPKIPPIPNKGMDNMPFECPYCFYIITVRDKKAWARHIFRDLMPYVCIFPGCSTPNKLYGGRRQWYHHVQQTHASTSGPDGTYDCSICKESSLPALTFQRHVGQHLEELALFLLPRIYPDENKDRLTDENGSNLSLVNLSAEGISAQYDDADDEAKSSDEGFPVWDHTMHGVFRQPLISPDLLPHLRDFASHGDTRIAAGSHFGFNVDGDNLQASLSSEGFPTEMEDPLQFPERLDDDPYDLNWVHWPETIRPRLSSKVEELENAGVPPEQKVQFKNEVPKAMEDPLQFPERLDDDPYDLNWVQRTLSSFPETIRPRLPTTVEELENAGLPPEYKGQFKNEVPKAIEKPRRYRAIENRMSETIEKRREELEKRAREPEEREREKTKQESMKEEIHKKEAQEDKRNHAQQIWPGQEFSSTGTEGMNMNFDHSSRKAHLVERTREEEHLKQKQKLIEDSAEDTAVKKAAIQQRKLEQERLEQRRPNKIAAKAKESHDQLMLTLWYCCYCSFGPHDSSLHPVCYQCAAPRCSRCTFESV